MIIKICGAILLGVLLSGIWFGLKILLDTGMGKIKKCNLRRFAWANTAIAALLPTILLSVVTKRFFLDYRSVTDWKSWIIVAVTVALTAWIISFNRPKKIWKGKEILFSAAEGILMEIPQRMMMQGFMLFLMESWGVNIYFSVPITALVWCVSIVIQALITKSPFDRTLVRELLSSFVFSVGAGVVLLNTRFILFTMIAHFFERVLSLLMKNARYRVREKTEEKIS